MGWLGFRSWGPCARAVGGGFFAFFAALYPADRPDASPQRRNDSLVVETPRLTWREVVKAVDRHPRLSAAAHQVAASRALAGAVEAPADPSIEWNTAWAQARNTGDSRVEWGLSLQFPLGGLLQHGARFEMGKAALASSQVEAIVLRREILLRLGDLFWDHAAAEARVETLEEGLKQTEALRKIVQTRVAQGEARPVEAMRLEVEWEKMRADLEAARLALGGSRGLLALWLGAPPGAGLRIEADLRALPELPTEEAVARKIRAQDPALLLERARLRERAAELEWERRAKAPSPAVRVFTAQELDRQAYGLSLNLEFPVWAWSGKKHLAARERQAATKNSLEALEFEAGAEGLELLAACRAQHGMAQSYRERILPRAEAAALVVEKTWRLGEAGLLDLMDARRTLLETRRVALASYIEARSNIAKLKTLMGEE